ncbi:MAG: helix-turn-helix domain-containing protein [Candidatus Paceibacterota bacterium]
MKQTQALDILKAGRNVYLTGSAGSGKTHTIRKYVEYLKERGVAVGLTASTGIAATHFGGVTIHSWSGIGVRGSLSPYEIEELIQKEYLWKRFDAVQVIIIDEVSMLTPELFDSFEALCRAMKGSLEPFGGMQVVLSGDFFQLPPVVRGSAEIRFAHMSDAWQKGDFRVCYLEEQFRQSDESLGSILNEMRDGDVSYRSRELLLSRKGATFSGDVVPTRLYTHNRDVDALNEKELEKLSGKACIYEMRTTGKSSIGATLKKGVLAPETLTLKEGAAVMFVKNNFEAGYVNGTLGTVVDFADGMPVVRTFLGEEIEVSPQEWSVEENGKVIATVSQIPLRLAWAITVHKSQGMSLDAAEMDLSQSFVPGQGYVALSRLRSLEGLSLHGLNEMALAVNPDVLELDYELRRDSKKWEQVIARFARDEMDKMHADFIKRCGGTNDPDAIAKNKARGAKRPKEKIPTHVETRALIEKGYSLKETAEERGLTQGTVIGHLLKLKELDPAIDLHRFEPKDLDLKKIKKAFAETDSTKLAPVYRKLKGVYTYDELRLAILFL